jgi:DNA-binding XRE family transcriptional regulator
MKVRKVLANVKAEMARHQKTNADMASALGVSKASFRMKLNEKREFTLSEARKNAEIFDVTVDYVAGLDIGQRSA